MGFGQVGVFRRDDDNPIPEILITLVIAQPVGDDVSLADVTAGIADGDSSSPSKM